MKKLLGIIVLGLLLSGNAYSKDLKSIFKQGISKKEMCKLTRNKKAISGTVLRGAAYCHKGLQSQYLFFQKYKTEIITPPNLPGKNYHAPVHFIFENVTIPMKCSFNTICKPGDGKLKAIAYSREEALAFADPVYAKTYEIKKKQKEEKERKRIAEEKKEKRRRKTYS